MENRAKIYATVLPICAWSAVAFVTIANASDARSGKASAPASSSAQAYCAELQQGISAQTFQFSGWRCKQGPAMRGLETILGWVTMTQSSGTTHVELVWVVETQPVQDAQVIDARKVPSYGYEPSDVTEAFRTPTGPRPSALTA